MEGLGSAAASGDSPEAHGHRRGMGRPAEERHWSVQRGARSQGQSLPGPTLYRPVSSTSEPVAALARPPGTAGLRGKEIKAAAGRGERARPGQAGTDQDRREVATGCHCPGSVLPGAGDGAGGKRGADSWGSALRRRQG